MSQKEAIGEPPTTYEAILEANERARTARDAVEVAQRAAANPAPREVKNGAVIIPHEE